MPQSPDPGAQLGIGIALVLEATALGVETEVAIAPVTARAITRLRTMIFMVLTPFVVTQSGRY